MNDDDIREKAMTPTDEAASPRTECNMCGEDISLGHYCNPLARIKELQAQIAALEAKIDRLVLEYCPDEMTPEQTANWAKHQKHVPEDFKDER